MKIDWDKAVAYEKIDGSLIRIFFYGNKWNIATRGTAFAESTVNGFDLTFKDLVLKALNLDEQAFQSSCDDLLDEEVTYVCEITSLENRVVRAYTGYTLYYLASRNNKTYQYVDSSSVCANLGMKLPRKYSFSSIEACQEVVKTLKNLDEGYVLYQDGVPVCKIKSPAYCAVHLLRGEGLNPKRISELVLTNEQEEYLTYFPEDRAFIQPYVDKLVEIHQSLEQSWYDNRWIESQKDFAIAIKNVKGNSILFTARKLGCSITESWNSQTDSFRLRLLLEEMV